MNSNIIHLNITKEHRIEIEKFIDVFCITVDIFNKILGEISKFEKSLLERDCLEEITLLKSSLSKKACIHMDNIHEHIINYDKESEKIKTVFTALSNNSPVHIITDEGHVLLSIIKEGMNNTIH